MSTPSDQATRGDRKSLPWQRPVAIILVTGLHLAAAYGLVIPRSRYPYAQDSIELTIAQGEPEPPAPPPPPPPPEPVPPAPVPPPPPPPPVPQPEPPPPPPEPTPPPPPPPVVKEVEDAPALPPPPKPPKPRPKPVVAPKPLPTPAPVPPDPPPQVAPPPQDQATPGEQQAANAAVMQAHLTYADKVVREVNARRLPANGHGWSRVALKINAAGEVTSAEIAGSSGDDYLDSIALRMVRSAHPGKPPEGHFEATIRINFVPK